jgi:multidrug efflux pump subunit AcrB
VTGPDKDEVTRIAKDLAQVVASDAGARHVNFDWIEPSRKLRIIIDQDQARQLGVSSRSIASVLNATVAGSTVTQVRDSIYLIDVVARADDQERASIATLRSMQVPIPGGRTVPLTQFASFEYDQEYPLVWRRNRVPTLTVLADVVPGALPDDVVARLAPKVTEFDSKLARPYKVETGGAAEESAESSASVFAVVPLMMMLMLTVLMFILQSFRRLGAVLVLLPMALIGVVLALLLFNRPLGFVAILGVLSLLGMVAKNAVILIVQIETDRAEGRNVWNAVVAAATSRLRPMALTALSTILGMIPIAPTVFWGPMAFAIMGGLLVATLLTLVFLPTVYVTIFRAKPGDPVTPVAQPATG